MILKNRFVAVLAAAAIAIPALAYAKKHSAAKGSHVSVTGKAIGVNFTVEMTDGLTVTDDGTTTAVSFDGHNLRDKDSAGRTGHMHQQVFPTGKRTWHVIVKNADIEKGLADKKIAATVKSAWGKQDVTITNFTKVGQGKDIKAKGTFDLNLKKMGVPEICATDAEIGGKKIGPCVKDVLTVNATVALKEDG